MFGKVTSAKPFGTYIISLIDTSIILQKLYVKDSLGNVRFGILKSVAGDTSTVNIWSPNNYAYNTTYLVVLKYAFIPGAPNDQVSLYVFSSGVPVTEPAPTFGPITFPSANAGQIRRVQLRQGEATRGPRVIIDGIMVSNNWGALGTQFQTGDVFTAVSNGQVQWRKSNGTIVSTLSTNQGGVTTGMVFDSAGRLFVTNFSANSISILNQFGAFVGTVGSGYSGPESVVFDNSSNFYVGNVGNGIRKFDYNGTYLGTSYSSQAGRIDLLSDQCTMLRDNEGTTLERHNVCTNTSLPTFASGLGGNAYAMRMIPAGSFSGHVLLANGINILRLNASGNTVQTYDAAGQDNWFAINLDPDGTTFWSADFGTSNVYRINIATGAIVSSFNTGTAPFTVFGLAVKGEITAGLSSTTQNPTYKLKASNFTILSVSNPNDAFEFDIILDNTTSPLAAIQYAAGQFYFDFNHSIANSNSELSYTIVGSDLPANMQPRNPRVGLPNSPEQNILCLAFNSVPTCGNGFIIPAGSSKKIVRMRLKRNSGSFNNQQLNLAWRNSLPNPYTKIFAYTANCTNTDITTPGTHIIGKKLMLTVGIQGFWNGTTQVADTVRCYLRNSVTPYSVIDSSNEIIDDDAYNFVFLSAPAGSYYLDIKHRNSIETWSANPVSFTGDSAVYDFTTAANKAYGNNMILKSEKYCFYSGDVNQDGVVDVSDAISVYNDAGSFVTGYKNTDVDGNNIVDVSDLLITYNNSVLFISKITPP